VGLGAKESTPRQEADAPLHLVAAAADFDFHLDLHVLQHNLSPREWADPLRFLSAQYMRRFEPHKDLRKNKVSSSISESNPSFHDLSMQGIEHRADRQ
jgi:hypothetical protein